MENIFIATIVLALALACAGGVQFFYLMFLEARSRQQRRRIVELERRCELLSAALEGAETRLAELGANGEEEWPETLGERDDYPLR